MKDGTSWACIFMKYNKKEITRKIMYLNITTLPKFCQNSKRFFTISLFTLQQQPQFGTTVMKSTNLKNVIMLSSFRSTTFTEYYYQKYTHTWIQYHWVLHKIQDLWLGGTSGVIYGVFGKRIVKLGRGNIEDSFFYSLCFCRFDILLIKKVRAASVRPGS